jgi:hypothetical protein
LLLLVRRNICGHKENSSQLVTLARRTRQRKMPAMNRIKRPAKESNVHAPLVSLFAAFVGQRNVGANPAMGLGTIRSIAALADRPLLALSVWPGGI